MVIFHSYVSLPEGIRTPHDGSPGCFFNRNSARSLHQDQGEVLDGSHAGKKAPFLQSSMDGFCYGKKHFKKKRMIFWV